MTARGGSPVVARDAATVVLARDAGSALEVLLLERHRASPMSPGAFAFPGGRVEPSDAAPDAAGACGGLTPAAAARLLPDVRPPERAIGFWVAALREVFEETGLLLASDGTGTAAVLDAAVAVEARRRCRSDSVTFGAILRERGWTLATDRMAYWAHWITPEERPVRYDTRFFVAAAFADGTPVPDGVEIVGFRWLGAEAALATHGAGELTLPTPTREILRSIAPYSSVAALLEAAPRREIRTVRPRIVVSEGRERILLPDDPAWY
jgi:8-oxo-dGTP pyrophosphatase MutT (NUDIX family)